MLDYSDDENLAYSDDENLDFEGNESEESDSSPSELIPKEERRLRTQAYDMRINDVVRMIKDGEIILNPEYQRNYVWDTKRASLLVESILINVPIPTVYLEEGQDSKWSVVDGLQRLYSLSRFFDNKFRLTGLEVLSELKGRDFDSMGNLGKQQLRNSMLRMIVITKESHPEIKYDVFMRLNRGSVKLNEQELRNCLYRGPFNELIMTMRKDDRLLAILRLKEPHKRLADAEMILRVFAIQDAFDSESGNVVSYAGKMKTFLNRAMDRLNGAFKEKPALIQEYKDRFNRFVSKLYSVFENNSFRRLHIDGMYESRINLAIMDVMAVAFTRYSEIEINAHKASIVSALAQLASDKQFVDSVTYGTSDKDKLEYRINTWIERVDGVIANTNL